MDPELKREIAEIHALARDSHNLLRSMRRHQLYSTFGKFAFWLVIILSSAYWFQTYLRPLVDKFTTVTGTPPSGLFGLPTFADIEKLINSFKPGQK